MAELERQLAQDGPVQAARRTLVPEPLSTWCVGFRRLTSHKLAVFEVGRGPALGYTGHRIGDLCTQTRGGGTAADVASVLAIVLTHDAPEALASCLRSLHAQTRRPDAVLVIDNASVPPALDAVGGLDLPAGWVTVCRQPMNSGPAGGHAAGLREFLQSAHGLAWVMDDDAVPTANCLERLLAGSAEHLRPVFAFPTWVQPDGTATNYPAWCGFLIAQEIVAKVGLPMEELFWWAEDTEYLFWRIPQAGFSMTRVPDAVVHHTQVRALAYGNPTWKYYYEARNNVFFHVHVKRNLRRLPRKLCLLTGRAILREEDRRIVRLVLIGRGVIDGLARRLGKRVPVEPAGDQGRHR